jgi:NAD(P)-dependent dehydrogenase (short-subunit alcohol dehydrogenase family)
VINLKAYFFACQAVVPGMRASGGGAIINTVVDLLHDGQCRLPGLHDGQWRDHGMTRSLAREFGPDRIRVNALAPAGC